VSHPTKIDSGSPIDRPVASSAPASSAVVASSVVATAAATPSPSSPAISRTPTAAAQATPVVLSSNDVSAGVSAAAHEFFDDLNIAFATGDLTKFEALTSPGCSCRSISKTIKDTYGLHQRIVDVTVSVKSMRVVSFVTNGASADVHFSISAGRVLDENGTQVNTSVADPNEHSAMFIVNVLGSWIVEQNTRLNALTP
jgi:hypothetical protein